MQNCLDLLTSLIALAASIMAFLSVKNWKQEATWKSDLETLETAYPLVCKACNALSSILIGNIYYGEGNEKYRHSDLLYRSSVILNRLDTNDDVYKALHTVEEKTDILFGSQENNPVRIVINSVFEIHKLALNSLSHGTKSKDTEGYDQEHDRLKDLLSKNTDGDFLDKANKAKLQLEEKLKEFRQAR